MNSKTNIPAINVGIFAQPVVHFVLNGNFHFPEISGTVTGECAARLTDNMIVIESNGVVRRTSPEITIQPDHAECSFILKDVTIGVQFHWQRNEDQKFVGGLKFVRSADAVAAINVVSIEDYLTSVYLRR